MEYVYDDLLESNFIKPPFSYIFIDKDIDEKVINHNVLVFTNSIYALKLFLQKDILFTSNKLCVVIINELAYKNDFSKYDTCLSDFFQIRHGFNPLKTKISFFFIPGIRKISYEILFLCK
ncbi:MAG: hypothetical protein H7Y18_17755 [Clostridiaceae bacterium]|nr:hypothetical protein [Clostridiaceae bacterium]